MDKSRRDFVKKVITFSGITFFAPQLFFKDPSRLFASQSLGNRILILVELKGGNDGLNTVIPYQDPLYYHLRPRLAIPQSQVLALARGLGFHPSMKTLMDPWSQGELAIALGVGYPNPNRSHFRSIEIWDTASDSDEVLTEGWVGRLLDGQTADQNLVADGLVVGRNEAGPLSGAKMRNIYLNNPKQFFSRAGKIEATATRSKNSALSHLLSVQNDIHLAAKTFEEKFEKAPAFSKPFPKHKLGRGFETIAKVITSNIPVGVIKISHGSFDTHSNQKNPHTRLLRELSDSLASFRTAMKERGQWDRVLVMTYSEFGRRAAENASGGTDHGTAAPHFLMGGKVRGGLYGIQPRLDQLQRKDLRHTMDYRTLYQTIAEKWWNLPIQFSSSTPFSALPIVS